MPPIAAAAADAFNKLLREKLISLPPARVVFL